MRGVQGAIRTHAHLSAKSVYCGRAHFLCVERGALLPASGAAALLCCRGFAASQHACSAWHVKLSSTVLLAALTRARLAAFAWAHRQPAPHAGSLAVPRTELTPRLHALLRHDQEC